MAPPGRRLLRLAVPVSGLTEKLTEEPEPKEGSKPSLSPLRLRFQNRKSEWVIHR